MNLTPEEQREQLIAIQSSLVMKNDITVLIVEDDTEDAYLAKTKLEAFGITAVVAENGDVACDMARSGEFTIVFLDWKLIGKTGFQTLRDIKESTPDCIVIVLTGASYDEYASQALKFGAAAVMLKPLTNEHIKLIFGKPSNLT